MESLGIDFKILFAQIINFLLLFFLLKKLLYKPIIGFLDQRKKKIEESLENAKRIEERLTKIEEEQKKILKKAEEAAAKIVQEKREAGEKERERLIEEARQKAREEMEKGTALMKMEMEKAREEFKNEARAVAVSIAERLLKEELNDKKKHQLIEKILS